MKIRGNRFNLNLLGIVLLVLVSGCRTEEGRRARVLSTLRVHIEVNRDGTDRNREIPVYRETPVLVNIDAEPFVTEEEVSEARVVETVGGFAIRITFGRRGAYLLDNATARNRGKHYAVFCQFASVQDPAVHQSRWLAAPLVTGRMADGVLMFTPDASREEAYEIILGLNNVAKQNHNTPADIEAEKKFFKYP